MTQDRFHVLHSQRDRIYRAVALIRPGLAAPAAVVAVMILAAPVIWLSAERGGGELDSAVPLTSQPATAETSQPDPTTSPAPAFSGLLGSVIDLLPDSFDPELASPLLAMDGNPEEVATQYLETRLPLLNSGVSRVEEQDGYTLVQWAWGRLLVESETEEGHSGWLLMRPTIRGFEILAATTDGIDLSDLTIADGSLRGVIQSSTDEFVGADVLDLDEKPVASAPNPDGFTPEADFPWGTAGAGTPPLALDLTVTEPVIVRVNRVGGTLLSISEVVIGQGSDDPDGTDTEDGLEEELVGEGEEPLAWGTAGDSPWVLVGWHLDEPGKPTQSCTGVRPVIDEDWCTTPDGQLVYSQAFAVGDGGVIVLRTQPGVSLITRRERARYRRARGVRRGRWLSTNRSTRHGRCTDYRPDDTTR
ncbi:MAG TPA: hypothetical protein VM848_08335 [Acidimicrobiia bacterium]|nr:hypothetical protein [Acidimicrobiia bacterium]